MKKNNSGKRGPQDLSPQPDKVAWMRKFCGKGIFREIWKNRFVVLRGDQLFICEKEVKEPGRADELLELTDFERCEEVRKNKSRSKKNHSKFRLQRCSMPGNTAPNLIFLAVSPEEKESWINVLNAAITRAKNRILDEVTVDDAQLLHLTRDRAKIPHNRRPPTRGHLLAVASTSTSDGMLTLDLIQEEDGLSSRSLTPECPRSKTDGALFARTAEASGKSQSLPRESVAVWEPSSLPHTSPKPPTTAEKSRCASMDEMHSHMKSTQSRAAAAGEGAAAATIATTTPINLLQELIIQNLERTEQLLLEVQGRSHGQASTSKGKESPDGAPAEAERLLREAGEAWAQAHQVLEEVKELQALYLQLDSTSTNSTKHNPEHLSQM